MGQRAVRRFEKAGEQSQSIIKISFVQTLEVTGFMFRSARIWDSEIFRTIVTKNVSLFRVDTSTY